MRWWDGAAWTEHRSGPPQPVVHQHHFHAPAKSVGAAYAFLLLLGGFAAHKFYLNQYGAAWLLLGLWWGGWLLTFIFIGYAMLLVVIIWFIVDLFVLPGDVDAINRRKMAATA